MHVRKLRLSGFKSFVQPTELVIERGLTGVVGPNGCGKSNLVEALRWVMGETSARGLRGGEMDDVIFSGTAARPAFDLAEVILQMTADGTRLPGFEDAEELELARRIGRGAGSAFRLNGRELRARDVQLLFADAASGARSAAIVSQGQIGALVDAKPAERRRLLEDAAGIAGLQARRHEAELKLRAAEANLLRIDDLLQTLGEQHDQLKKQARQAKRYGEIGTKLREVEARLLVARWQRATTELESARAVLEHAEREVADADETLLRLRNERETRRADLATRRQAATDLATEAARLAERVTAAEATVRDRQARRTRLEEQRAALEDELRETTRTTEEARRQVDRLGAGHAALEGERAAAAAARERAGAEAEARAGALSAAEVEHRALVGRHGELQAGSAHRERERGQLEQERRDVDALAGSLEQRAKDLRAAEPAAPDPEGLATAEAAAADAGRALEEATRRVDAAQHAREAAREALAAAGERLQAAERVRDERARQLTAEREAREGFAARRDELLARRHRLLSRRDEVSGRLDAARTEVAALALDRLERELHAATAAAGALDQTRTAKREARDAAEAARQTAEERVRGLRSEIERMTAEAAALAEVIADTDHPSVLEAVAVGDGHADALAAALGDDLLAGLEEAAPAHWCGATGDHQPEPLPEGARPLADLVAGPTMLEIRLAQVGVVAAAHAPALQAKLRPGQRLVSPAGDLWRWDGYVRRAEALGPVAARLRHASRRRALEDLLATRRHDLAAAEGLAGTHGVAVADANAEVDETERQLARAATAVRDLERRLGDGRARGRALDAEDRNYTETLEALDHEVAELDLALGEVAAELAAVPGDRSDDQAPDDAATAALQRACDEARRAEEEAARRLEEARNDLAHCRSRDESSRRTLEEARSVLRSAEVAWREHAFAEERLAAERAGLDERRTALAERAAELSAAEAALGGDCRTVAAALDRSGETIAALGAELAAARAAEQEIEAQLQSIRDRQHGIEADLRLWRERGETATARSGTLEGRLRAVDEELESVPPVADDEPGRGPLRTELARLEAAAGEAEEQRLAGETEIAELEERLAATETARGLARERAVRGEAESERAAGALAEAMAALRARPLPPDFEVDEEIPDRAGVGRLEEELARLEASRERLGPVNLRALDELRELELRLATLQSERDELVQAIERLRRAINALNREGRQRLEAAFAEIEKHFEALFVRLFGGGKARLSLTDLEDPLAAGLELAASPPGKKLQSLSLLSGGEKALTALALIFAVFLSRPSPLCILDEVDAPLDDANVERFGLLLDELARGTDTRFVVVTHHPLTMAQMDRLYGVTMLERGVSELVSVDLSRAIELRQSA